jgi:hypothetical protein
MLKMYFFRAGSVSDFVQNDFGDLDLCTGNPWDTAVVDFDLRGDPLSFRSDRIAKAWYGRLFFAGPPLV